MFPSNMMHFRFMSEIKEKEEWRELSNIWELEWAEQSKKLSDRNTKKSRGNLDSKEKERQNEHGTDGRDKDGNTEKEFASKKCHGEREIHSNDKYSIPRYTQKRERVINQTSK